MKIFISHITELSEEKGAASQQIQTSWETEGNAVISCWGHTCAFCPTNSNGGRTQAFEQDFGQKAGDGAFRLKNVYSQTFLKNGYRVSITEDEAEKLHFIGRLAETLRDWIS